MQHAVNNLADARGDEERARWREIADLYRAAGADFDLIVAIYLDDLPRVKEILSKTPAWADDFQSQSPLRTAARLDRLAICRYLIEQHHVDLPDLKRGIGYPIIKEALAHPRIVRLLIKHELDSRVRSRG